MPFPALLALLFLCGFVDSIGGGGGLISLPAYLAAGLPAHLAQGTNKMSNVIGTATAALRFWKKGYVAKRAAVFALAGALIGAAVGSRTVLLFTERQTRAIMLVLIPIAAAFLFFRRTGSKEGEGEPAVRAKAHVPFLIGFFIGFYDGFFGPGTGTFLILAFVSVLGMKELQASGTAKAVNFASNLGSLIVFAANRQIDYKIGLSCAVMTVLGNMLGSEAAFRGGRKAIRAVMACVIIGLLAKIAFDFIAAAQ